MYRTRHALLAKRDQLDRIALTRSVMFFQRPSLQDLIEKEKAFNVMQGNPLTRLVLRDPRSENKDAIGFLGSENGDYRTRGQPELLKHTAAVPTLACPVLRTREQAKSSRSSS